jgi:hypothetical protein
MFEGADQLAERTFALKESLRRVFSHPLQRYPPYATHYHRLQPGNAPGEAGFSGSVSLCDQSDIVGGLIVILIEGIELRGGGN